MIRLVQSPTFDCEVNFAAEGMEPAVAKFIFRAHSLKRARSLAVATGAANAGWFRRNLEFAKLCWRARKWATTIDLLDEMIDSWDGFDVPYNKESLKLLLANYPAAAVQIYFKYFTGLMESRRKN